MAVDRSALPALGADPVLTFPAIHRDRLANGLQVWAVSHRAVPATTAILLLPAGAASDPPDRPGLAALTGDLVDEGAGGRSALELHDALARLGARLDTDVGADATTLSLTVLSRHLDRALDLVADVVCRPAFDEAEFARVRERRLHRLIQLRDQPSAVADRAFLDLLYPDHPYGHLAVGTEASLRAVTLDEVRALHDRAYALSEATLIVVGDADPGDLLAAGARAFANRPHAGTAAGAPAAPSRPGPPRARFALVDRPRAAQSELRVGCVATSRHTPEYHALLVLNMVVGGQFVSRVNLNLRERKGYTYGARSAFDLRRGPGPFLLQASVQTDATAEAIREALGELEDLRGSRPADDAELEGARAALTRGYPRSFETAGQIARGCAQLALYELPDEYFVEFVPRVRAVDGEAVTAVARKYFAPEGLVTLVVGDRERVLPVAERAGLGAIQELESSV